MTSTARQMVEELAPRQSAPPSTAPTPFFLACVVVESICGVIRWVSGRGTREEAAYWQATARDEREETKRLQAATREAQVTAQACEDFVNREFPVLKQKAALWRARAKRERHKLQRLRKLNKEGE